MSSGEIKKIKLQGCSIPYVLERKNVKNINLRIRQNGNVYVSANSSIPEEEIETFIMKKSGFVLDALKQFEEQEQYRQGPKQYVSGEAFYILGRGLRLQVRMGEKTSIYSDGVFLYLFVKKPVNTVEKERIVTRYLDQQCRKVFGEILAETYPQFAKYGVAAPVLRIRNMETRWGSCLAKKGIITLNKRLLEAPRNCIEYVITHELCHFVHPDHSRAFYDLLTMFMPDWRERKKILDKNALYWE